jgi:hypothetical protein
VQGAAILPGDNATNIDFDAECMSFAILPGDNATNIDFDTECVSFTILPGDNATLMLDTCRLVLQAISAQQHLAE